MNTEVSLTLNDEERDLMREILEEHHRRLLREIARADHHDFKVVLREKERILESLLGKLVVSA